MPITYRYGQEISLVGIPAYSSGDSGRYYVFTLADENNFQRKVRTFRNSDDPVGALRAYNNDQNMNVLVEADTDWTQVPGMDTDLTVVGDWITGTLTFRAHIEPEPVGP